jgi:ABC-type polysaccharide/polyol phosphate transport system ATPase subunit
MTTKHTDNQATNSTGNRAIKSSRNASPLTDRPIIPEPIVEVNDVSKRFMLNSGQARSMQEYFINLFGLRKQDEQAAKSIFWALKNVSFQIEQGNSVGIIGPNGSGKSTLLKLLVGILQPTTGQVIVRGRVSSLLELGAGFHPDLTGRENIYLNATIYGINREQTRERIDSIIDFAEIGDFIDMPVKHYSSGMYVRLGFAVAIHTEPDFLIVDEVLAVGDASFQYKCLNAIHDFRRKGGTLLLVSHDLATIQAHCAEALWLDKGTVKGFGPSTDVVMSYLNWIAKQYNSKMEAEKAEEEDEDKDSAIPAVNEGNARRWGTQSVQITEVELLSRRGELSSTFITSEPMQIKIHYRAHRKVERPIFGLALYHEGGTHICGPNTRFDKLYIPEIEGDGSIVYNVPTLALLEGTYDLSVAIVNSNDTETYDHHDRLYRFRVFPGPTLERYGLVSLGGTWQSDILAEDVDSVMDDASTDAAPPAPELRAVA